MCGYINEITPKRSAVNDMIKGKLLVIVIVTSITFIILNITTRMLGLKSYIRHGFVKTLASQKLTLKSDRRGYVALLYSGTARSFSSNFESHIVNLMAACPYTVHIFIHTCTNDNRYPDTVFPSEHRNYLSVNSTLEYFEGYQSIDNENVYFRSAVKANILETLSIDGLRYIYKDTYDTAVKGFPVHPPISSIYYMWHSQRRSEELRQAYVNKTEINYKWIFRMRHDVTYYTNWWQQAFDLKVVKAADSQAGLILHDIAEDWGVRVTLLYDIIYIPRLRPDDVIFAPSGWSWGGYNDQFAAMSSKNAQHYFKRIMNVDKMLREGRVHPETSIKMVAKWNNVSVVTSRGNICYDIVRAIPNENHPLNKNGLPNS
jgi:hypothetical protein